MFNIDYKKLNAGLDKRLISAMCAQKGRGLTSDFSRLKDSIARDYHSEICEENHNQERQNKLDIIVTKVSFQRVTIEEQHNTFDSCKEFTRTKYLSSLILGHKFEPAQVVSLQDISSSMDYSLYVQYLLYSGKVKPSAKLTELLASFYEEVNLIMFGTKSPTIENIFNIRIIKKPATISLSSLRSSLLEIKLNYWHIFGVDILNTLISCVFPIEQFLLTKKHRASTGWSSFIDLFLSLWSSSDIFISNEEQATRIIQSEAESKETEAKLQQIVSHRLKSGLRKEIREPSLYSFSLVFEISRKFKKAIREQDIHLATKWLCALSLIDSAYFMILDWYKLNKLINRNCGVFTYSRAFIELKFLHAEKIDYFSKIDRGLGTLTGTLAEKFEHARQSSKTTKQIIADIKTSLPRPAAIELTEFLLSLRSLERFSTKLPLIASPKFQIRDDERIMGLRLEMAESANDLHVISKLRKSQILAQEKRAFAMRKLKNQVSKGMLRVSWDIISANISEFTADISLYEEMLEGTDQHDRLFKLWTEHLVETILFDGANSLDYILGANLRHGRILTAYMSAFTKSVRQEQGVGIAAFDWEDPKVKEILGAVYTTIDDCRNSVSALIKEYIDFWLTINDDGMLSKTLNNRISKYCGENSSLSKSHVSKFNANVFTIVNDTIFEFVTCARENFTTEIIPEITNLVLDTRNSLIENGSMLGDIINNEVVMLNKDVPRWINIVVNDDEYANFSATGIVNLECEFSQLRKIDDCPVNVSCTKNEKFIDDITFDGRSFLLINEIVHNLFSNSVKYSGQELGTRIHFQFNIIENDLEIRCQNSLSQKGKLKCLEKLTTAKKKAQSTELNQRRQDEGSGFAKIRTIFEKYHPAKIKINILFNKNSVMYEVVVKISGAADELLV